MEPLRKFGHGQWGTRSIHEDIHRTYANPNLPRRDEGAFARAARYRAKELEQHDKLRQDHGVMVTKFNAMSSALEDSETELKKTKDEYAELYAFSSKLVDHYELSSKGNTASKQTNPVRPTVEAGDASDSRGPSTHDDSEGRQEGGDDPATVPSSEHTERG